MGKSSIYILYQILYYFNAPKGQILWKETRIPQEGHAEHGPAAEANNKGCLKRAGPEGQGRWSRELPTKPSRPGCLFHFLPSQKG